MATARISPPKTQSNFQHHLQKGFTLLEVMIVLAIIGAVMAVGLPRFRNQENDLKKTARQMSALFREVRNEARLKRMTYRLAFRLGEKDAYWVESAPGNVLVPSKATLESLESRSDSDRPASPFQKSTRLIKEEKPLPGSLKFGSVETQGGLDPVTDGMAYIYFSPEGLSEKAVVQITNAKGVTWSLILNPLTGHSDIEENAVKLKDLEL